MQADDTLSIVGVGLKPTLTDEDAGGAKWLIFTSMV